MGRKISLDSSRQPELSEPERALRTTTDSEGLAALDGAVNRLLVDADDELTALRDSMATIGECLDAEVARFWALDAEQESPRLAATTGALEPPQSEALPDAVEGLITAALRVRAPLWIADVPADGRASTHDLARPAATPSVLLVPAPRRGACRGVFEFCLRGAARPSAPLLQSLNVLTGRVVSTYSKLARLRQLEENDECSNSTFALAAIGISHVAEDGTLIHVNRTLCELLGYSEEELVGRKVQDISHPEDVSVTREQRERLRSGEVDSFTAEKRYLRKDGTPVWVRLTVAARRDERGEIMYHVSVVEDISDRKAAEEALRASEVFYHETFELAAIGISHVGADGRHLDE